MPTLTRTRSVLVDKNLSGSPQSLDVKISVPELTDIGPFWIRGYGTHRTFEELYQECVNHEEVRRSRSSLEASRASRHFWFGDQFMPRVAPLSKLAPKGGDGARGEVSLVLRRDYYRIRPGPLVARGEEYNYVNAEASMDEVITQVLNREEKPCCFDLCDYRNRRMTRTRSLADYGLWPAWEDAPAAEFPERANLLLRPRVSWLPMALMAVALIIGTTLGYMLLSLLLNGSGR